MTLRSPIVPKQRRALLVTVVLLAASIGTGCGSVRRRGNVKLPPPINPRVGWTETGTASWYGPPYHGRPTANGEIYDMNEMTAAHQRLSFDTWLEIRNLDNGKTANVRINDRGPFVGKRIIDLSKSAAQAIGMLGSGTAPVRLRVIRPPKGAPAQASSGSRPGQMDIQIGVFTQEKNAQALASKARSKGHRVTVEDYSTDSGKRYRVVVSGGNSKQANSRLKNLKKQGFQGIFRPRKG